MKEKMDPAQYFASGEPEAKRQWQQKVAVWQRQHPSIEAQRIEVEPSYFVDTLFLPASKAERLLILLSGVHGVEAFAGCAIQHMFVDRIWNPNCSYDTLIVHTCNPWGFRNLRRVTSKNIDLNRNMHPNSQNYQRVNRAYGSLKHLLEPDAPAGAGHWEQVVFFARILIQAVAKSPGVVRQGVLQGQHQSPQGLFYGGERQAFAFLKEALLNLPSKYQEVWAVDLHTGYGSFAELSLFGSPSLSSEQRKKIEATFGGTVVTGNDSDFYRTSGDVTSYLKTILPGETSYFPITFEFGTAKKLSFLGSLLDLYWMVKENQGFHHGWKSAKAQQVIQQKFVEIFYQADPVWQKAVLEKAFQSLSGLDRRF